MGGQGIECSAVQRGCEAWAYLSGSRVRTALGSSTPAIPRGRPTYPPTSSGGPSSTTLSLSGIRSNSGSTAVFNCDMPALSRSRLSALRTAAEDAETARSIETEKCSTSSKNRRAAGSSNRHRGCRQHHARQGPQLVRGSARAWLLHVTAQDCTARSSGLAEYDQSLHGHRNGALTTLSSGHHVIDDQPSYGEHQEAGHDRACQCVSVHQARNPPIHTSPAINPRRVSATAAAAPRRNESVHPCIVSRDGICLPAALARLCEPRADMARPERGRRQPVELGITLIHRVWRALERAR